MSAVIYNQKSDKNGRSMALQRATIKDIARIAEVSQSAVSMVLNDRGGLSESTREKILRTIKDMDYHPSAASQRLVHKKSFNIAFMYPIKMSPFSDLFYNEVASGLTLELTENQLNVVFVPLTISDDECEIPNIINKQDADGVVCLHDTPTIILDRLDELELPYVLLDWQSATDGRPNISFDCEQSMFKATIYLIQKGHKKK